MHYICTSGGQMPRHRRAKRHNMRQMNNIKGISFALLASVTFGFLPLFSKPLIDMGLPVSSLLFYRFLISAVIVSAVCAAGRVNLRVTGRQLAILAFLAVLYVLSGTCLVRSYVYIPSGIATTIHFMYPVAVTAIMVFVFKERKSKTIFTAMLLAITGVALLSWNTAAPLNTKGLLLAGSTIFAYAIYLIMVNRSSVSRLDSMPMMFYIFVIGSAVFALSTVIDGGIRQPEGAFQWSMITGLAIISTVIPNIALIKAVKNAGSVVTSILGSAEPLTALIVGILYFGEDFSYRTIIGFILIMCAVTLVILNKNRENNPFVRLNKYFSLQKQKGNLKV
ncbi:MAG: EamA family transporter [Flavobacteriales bacterium]|nr:MAG: EamA family transporter [Flavobacteriales bacterium]